MYMLEQFVATFVFSSKPPVQKNTTADSMDTSEDWPLHALTRYVCRGCFPQQFEALPHVVDLLNIYLGHFLDQRVFTSACGCGANVAILEFYLNSTAPDWKNAITSAAKSGHLHVLQWMVGKCQVGRGPWRDDFKDALEEAAAFGHLDIAKWLYSSGVASCIKATYRVAGNGHLETLKWCYEHFSDSISSSTMESAAGNGHLQIVQWLDDTFLGAVSSSFAVKCAVMNGHLEVVKWFHKNKPGTWFKDVMTSAVWHGHLSIAQWLLDNGHTRCPDDVATGVNYTGNMELLMWLHKHFPDKFTPRVMNKAAGKGYLDVVKWLHNHRTEGCTTRAMDVAAAHGHLEVVQWLHDNRQEGCTTDAMDWAAGYGHLSVVRWLHENRSEGCTTSAMGQAADNGHLEVVQFLHHHRTEGTTKDFYGMSIPAYHGHLDVVCFLHDSNRNRFFGQQLRDAAGRGYLEVLKVLLLRTDRNHHTILYGDVIDKWATEVLNQVRKSYSSNNEVLERIDGALEWFHCHGFNGCVSRMLQLMVKRGYLNLVQRLLKRKHSVAFSKQIKIAAKYCRMPLMRWLIENGPPLDIATALSVVKKYEHVEVTWWFSEAHRVSIVCEVLREEWPKQKEMLLWILENTSLGETSSRFAIRDALQRAPDNISQWLAEHLQKPEVYNWCFSGELKSHV